MKLIGNSLTMFISYLIVAVMLVVGILTGLSRMKRTRMGQLPPARKDRGGWWFFFIDL